MVAKSIFLLLPALVCATDLNFSIKIDVSGDQHHANVKAEGFDSRPPNQRELDIFHLLKQQDLSYAVNKCEGRRPVHVSPTVIKKMRLPINARVLEVTTSPPIFAYSQFENHSHHRANYSTKISQEVNLTVSTTTDNGANIAVGLEVEYVINFVCSQYCIGKVQSLNFRNNWGDSATKTQKFLSDICLPLKYPEERHLESVSYDGTMVVEVEYKTNVYYGKVDYDYYDDFTIKRTSWAYVPFMLTAAGLPTNIITKEIIKINFYSNTQITVSEV